MRKSCRKWLLLFPKQQGTHVSLLSHLASSQRLGDDRAENRETFLCTDRTEQFSNRSQWWVKQVLQIGHYHIDVCMCVIVGFVLCHLVCRASSTPVLSCTDITVMVMVLKYNIMDQCIVYQLSVGCLCHDLFCKLHHYQLMKSSERRVKEITCNQQCRDVFGSQCGVLAIRHIDFSMQHLSLSSVLSDCQCCIGLKHRGDNTTPFATSEGTTSVFCRCLRKD